MASPMASEKLVDDRISIIAGGLKDDEDFNNKQVPGLKSLLDDYLDPDVEVDRIHFTRRLLKVFKDSETDMTYQDFCGKYDDTEQSHLERFVEGTPAEEAAVGFKKGPSLGLRDEVQRLQSCRKVKLSSKGVHVEGLSEEDGSRAPHDHHHTFSNLLHRLAEFFIGDDKEESLTVYQDVKFENWGRTVANTPAFTCVPTTVAAVQRVVRFAKEHDMNVRCAGYRHSWAPLYGREGQILISTLQLHEASDLPNTTALPLPENPPTELESIEFTKDPELPGGKRLVRIGCATTNERLRRWCIANNTVTIPMNTIMTEMTLGGSNAPICHGAGRRNKNLSDIIRRIEYVDANGELQKITEKDDGWLKAAAGCFGLMGVITHLTFQLDPMTYALMRPAKLPVIQAIPPPPGMSEDLIPPALRPRTPLTDQQKSDAQKAFEKRANDFYYSEWFWFPYSDLIWVNCWENTTEPSDVQQWPSDIAIFLSFIEEFTMNVLQYAKVLDTLIQKTGLAEASVTLFSRFAMLNLPEIKDDEMPIKTHLPDALHFQRAIQNIRVRDLEVEMPLVPSKQDPTKVDYSTVQQAWWDAILKAYEHSKDCPQRMPLEIRIMGGSDMIMAPQRGNSLGTAAIEILTLQSAVDIWQPYAQEVLDKWMSYTDSFGRRLTTKPHWAKEWYPYTVDGQPWLEKVKNEDYKEDIPEFRDTLAQIGKAHGWTLSDLKTRFSNDLFDYLIFDNSVAH